MTLRCYRVYSLIHPELFRWGSNRSALRLSTTLITFFVKEHIYRLARRPQQCQRIADPWKSPSRLAKSQLPYAGEASADKQMSGKQDKKQTGHEASARHDSVISRT